MPAYFCDTSAIIKRYIKEKGSQFVEGIADLKSGNKIFLAQIAQVEIAAAIARKQRGNLLTQADAQNALTLFQYDLTNNYLNIEISQTLLNEAVSIATKHALRGYDAVQLSSAMQANFELLQKNLSPLVFVSADNELNAAAISEGLTVENPNNYP
ncbi:MAG: type II toxin-antitoxin system VapC family toxin [Pyrinomonadaceae bacterium]|nr:type II toxin-antitoxin system VapC family toxin [Pyrinomonadaceae bacterium]